MRDWLSFAPFVVGMAVEAYFLPWLFVAQIIVLAVFMVIKN